MLKTLDVRDFARLHEIHLSLPQLGFCVLTGETGAGKSLLLGALEIAAGGRFNHGQIRSGAARAEVAAEYAVSEDAAVQLTEDGFDVSDGHVLIRRVAEPSKRTRSFLNGSPCPASQITSLCANMIAVFGQHDHILLLSAERRREQLDFFAGATKLAHEVSQAHTSWRKAHARMLEAQAAGTKLDQQRAQLDDALSSIDQAGQEPEAYARHSTVLAQHGNAAELAEIGSTLRTNLEQIAAAARDAKQAASRAKQINPADTAAGELETMIADADSICTDALRTVEQRFSESIELDQNALAAAEEYVAETHRLMRVHNCISPEDLFDKVVQMRKQREQLDDLGSEAAQQDEADARASWQAAADKLTAKRKAAAKRLSSLASARLGELGMKGGKLEIVLTKVAQDTPHAHGAESVAIMFAARASDTLRAIEQAASGGELSRLALALYSTGSLNKVHAMVFDEIDAGVGGKVAAAVGTSLAELGKSRLVLTVTHLPQVAAAAKHHWRMEVDQDGMVQLVELDEKGRAEEIARMLAGKKISEASRRNAREIIDAARQG